MLRVLTNTWQANQAHVGAADLFPAPMPAYPYAYYPPTPAAFPTAFAPAMPFAPPLPAGAAPSHRPAPAPTPAPAPAQPLPPPAPAHRTTARDIKGYVERYTRAPAWQPCPGIPLPLH